ncbi:MAG: response regulator transcription factor [Candidatus Acidiferrales bacterium]
MEPDRRRRPARSPFAQRMFSDVALYSIPLVLMPTPPKLRILIADDSAPVRRGITALLLANAGWEICGEAADGPEALQKTVELKPDLVLLDISMPGISGLDAARMIRESVPGTRILIMSQHDTAHMLPGVLDAGAQGCIDKGSLSIDLFPAIESCCSQT